MNICAMKNKEPCKKNNFQKHPKISALCTFEEAIFGEIGLKKRL